MIGNNYYQEVIQRENLIADFFFNLFFKLASYPRLLLEVFVRKNFGRRYFTIPSVITVALISLFLPYLFYSITFVFGKYSESHNFWGQYASWYIFIILFLVFSFKRWREVKNYPTTFDFKKYSKSAGYKNPVFFQVKIFDKEPSHYLVETLIEPGFFFIIGFVLWILSQKVGMFIMINSIVYSISYIGAYRKGTNFLLDRMDILIMQEELMNAFVLGLAPEKTRGVEFYMERPSSQEARGKVSAYFFEDDVLEAS